MSWELVEKVDWLGTDSLSVQVELCLQNNGALSCPFWLLKGLFLFCIFVTFLTSHMARSLADWRY